MAYVRLIHPSEYDRVRRRFISFAFRASSDGGISIFDVDCAKGHSNSICAHAKQYYESRVHGQFVLFWQFDPQILPKGSRLEKTKGGKDDKDPCHHDIFDLKDKEARKIITKIPVQEAHRCRNGHSSAITDDDLREMIAAGVTRPFPEASGENGAPSAKS